MFVGIFNSMSAIYMYVIDSYIEVTGPGTNITQYDYIIINDTKRNL